MNKDKRNENKQLIYSLWGREEVYTGLCCGNPRERDCLEDPGVDGRIILR
jgi:hypothetical protein